MTTIKCRSAILGLALAALLVPALAATGPRAVAAASSCANTVPVFFGLHGMKEGPSKKHPEISPEIKDFDHEQNLISGAVLNFPVSYRFATTSLRDMIHLGRTVATGVKHLQSDLAAYTKGCTLAQDKVALVGYSMGAWVINTWLLAHPGEWKMIRAVVLYGDPCWVDGSDKGLLRLFTSADGVNSGCSPAKYYPHPAPHKGDKVPPMRSYCMYHDPVCGGGFGGHKVKQGYAATQCTDKKCPHLQYRVGLRGEKKLKLGAQFVVKKLVG